mgnify:CR=1 FL=1
MQNPHLQSDFPAHALRKRLRKSFVSGSFGFSNSSFGGLSSTITPFAMKITRLETSRANAISWVTMIMVRPSCARSLITSRTSPTIWGIQRGGWLVEKKNFRLHGKGSCDCHTLFLTSGKLFGFGVDVRRHTYFFQIIQSFFSLPLLCSFSKPLPDLRCSFSEQSLLLKRLKFWNTIPTFERYSGTFTFLLVMSVP